MMGQEEFSKKPTLVFVSAASHSGSTLSSLLIASHQKFCTVGELKATNLGDVDKYRCACLEPIKACGFWRDVHNKMEEKGLRFRVWEAGTNFSDTSNGYAKKLLKPLVRNRVIEFFRDTLLYLSPSWRYELKQKLKRNLSLIQSLHEISGKQFIVDSSKIGLRLKFLLRIKEIDIKVVRLVRDGRGVALTYVNPVDFADAKDKKLRGGGSGESRDHEVLNMYDAAREWRRSNEEAEEILKVLPKDNWVQIRYEDICRDTIGTLNKVYDFLGVEPITVLPNFRAANKHVIGNGMRLDSDSTIELDERWREVLTEKQLREFNKVAGTLNRRYGYV